MGYVTISEHEPEEVFDYIDQVRSFGKYRIPLTSIRYKVFDRQHSCQHCGLEGIKFLLQYQKKGSGNTFAEDDPNNELGNNYQPIFEPDAEPTIRPHLNFYGIKDGKYILLTMDHIVPRSKGGRTILSNLQNLCFPCNQKKGSGPNE